MNKKRIYSLMTTAVLIATLTACNDAPPVAPIETPRNENTGQQRLDAIGENIENKWHEFADVPLQQHIDNGIEGAQKFGRATVDAVEQGVQYSNETGFTDKVLDNFEQIGDSFKRFGEQFTH